MKSIILYGKEIKVRELDCKHFKQEQINELTTNKVSLFIQTTKVCQANCPFCIYKETDNFNFDVKKLGKIINDISKRPDIEIRKLNFTGGEPCLNINLFEEQIGTVKENLFNRQNTEVTLNTNGINILNILKYEDFIDSIGLSRHHYLDEKNNEIFGCKNIPQTDELKEFYTKLNRKNIFQLRCNLITGYIDSFDEIKNYMDDFLNEGMQDFGFVTLAPNNEFCKLHQVEFKKLIEINENILKVNEWERFENNNFNTPYCKCANYVYSNDKGKIGKFYARLFCNNYNTDGVLVYDGKYLRHGFDGEIIY